jgi:hypothetical protein
MAKHGQEHGGAQPYAPRARRDRSQCRQGLKSGTGKHTVADPDGVESQRFRVLCQLKDLMKFGHLLVHDDFPSWK